MVVSATGGPTNALGLRPGMVVQELGWDADVDEELRHDIMDAIDADLIEEAEDAVDAVVLWLRDDTDVADGLVDALIDLSDDGYIWLLTPKIGRDGYVASADLAEGAKTAGMTLASAVEVSKDWSARKVVRPKGARR